MAAEQAPSTAAAAVVLDARVEAEVARYNGFINQALAGEAALKTCLPLKAPVDLFDACADGVLIAKLINFTRPGTVADNKLVVNIDRSKLNEVGSRAVFDMTANLNLAIEGAKAIGVKVVNIAAADIIEKKVDLVLGLVWQVIRVHLLKDVNLVTHPELIRLLQKGESINTLIDLPSEQVLLRWVNYHLRRAKHDRVMTNFAGDVADGVNYLVLLKQIAPKLVDIKAIDQALASGKSEVRHQVVVATAEKLGTEAFITPAIIAAGQPRLNLAFVATLFNKHIGIVLPTEEEVAELFDSVSNLKQEIKVWQTTAETNSTQSVDRENHMAAELKKLHEQFEAQKRDMVTQFEALRAEKRDVEAASSQQQQAVRQLEQKVAEAETTKATLQASLEQQAASKKDLDDFINFQKNKINHLQEQLQQSQASVSQLNASLVNETAAKDILASQLVELSSQTAQLTTAVTQLSDMRNESTGALQAQIEQNELLRKQLAEQQNLVAQHQLAMEQMRVQVSQTRDGLGVRVAQLEKLVREQDEQLNHTQATMGEWRSRCQAFEVSDQQYEANLLASLRELTEAIGTLGEDEDRKVNNMDPLPRSRKLQTVIIKKYQDQKRLTETLMDKIALVSEELNKNARLKACAKCGHTLDVMSPFAQSSSSSASKVLGRIGKGLSELTFGPDV